MKGFKAESIRNVTVLGHIGCGKTSFIESILLETSTIKEKGSIEKGTTTSDFLKEEKSHKMSLQTSIIPVEHKNNKINFFDTPGLNDLSAEVTAALKVSSSAILVIDASKGIEVGTEAAWEYLRKYSIPTFIFLNKMDKDDINFEKLIEEINLKFGKLCIPLCVPDALGSDFTSFTNVVNYRRHDYKNAYKMTELDSSTVLSEVNKYRNMLEEACAEVDETLLENFFKNGKLTIDEIYQALTLGELDGSIVPILVGSAEKNIGVDYIVNKIIDNTYPPVQERVKFKDSEDETDIYIDPFKEFVSLCFKTTIDPYLGQMNFVQVKSGHLKKDQIIIINDGKDKYKIANIYFVRGNLTEEVDKVYAGDICAITKIDEIRTNDVIKEPGSEITVSSLPKHLPLYFKSIKAKNLKEEEKLSQVLNKIKLTDRSLSIERNPKTKQLILGTQGLTHTELIVEKIKNVYGVETYLEDVEVVYKETILSTCQVEAKYKKQSGGAGHYAHVFIKFMPSEKEFEFVDETFGGSVPKNYIPAVEKGLIEACEKGVLAEYHVTGIKAVLYDGSYHDVDSSDFAFRTAASIAFKDGLPKARPVLLEPVYRVSVTTPTEYIGDIISDFSKRRGVVQGTSLNKNKQVIKANVPESEMFNYIIDLKQITQGKASFEMEFLDYEQVPKNIEEKVILKHKNS